MKDSGVLYCPKCGAALEAWAMQEQHLSRISISNYEFIGLIDNIGHRTIYRVSCPRCDFTIEECHAESEGRLDALPADWVVQEIESAKGDSK